MSTALETLGASPKDADTNWLLSDDDKMATRLDLPGDESKLEELQFDTSSPLATGGQGADLPNYVGALPPKGEKPWDWSATWRSRALRRK